MLRKLSGKPARIFYLSDFDPSGTGMPVSVARKMEFYARIHQLDIRLQPLALTKAQVKQYKLPGIPTKVTDFRAAGFIDRYGDRATELDAHEALHLGVLRRLVAAALAPYVDETKLRAIDAETTLLREAYGAILDTLPLADLAQLLTEQSTIAYAQGQGLTSGFAYATADHVAAEDDDPLPDTTRDYDTQIAAYKAYRGACPIKSR